MFRCRFDAEDNLLCSERQLNKKCYEPRLQLLTYVATNVTYDQAFLWEVRGLLLLFRRISPFPEKRERLIAGCNKRHPPSTPLSTIISIANVYNM